MSTKNSAKRQKQWVPWSQFKKQQVKPAASKKVKKVVNRQPKKATKSKKNVKVSFDTDLRNDTKTKDFSNNNTNIDINPSLAIESELNTVALQGVSLGVISFALSRGFSEYVLDPYTPYYAYVYITQTLINYATNTTLSMDKVPKWLNHIGTLLSQKTIPFYHGDMSMKFKLSDLIAPDDMVITLGPTIYGKRWNIGVVTSTPVNTHFVEIDTTAPSYTTALGEGAVSALFNFLQTAKGLENHPLHVMVPGNAKNIFSGDTSAYAVVDTLMGG
jgi:hypothetical protein